MWQSLYLLAVLSTSRLVSTRPALGSRHATSASFDYLIGPSVVEVPSRIRNVFPAENFNRNVTTTWWMTEVLNGEKTSAYEETVEVLTNASIIVLDQDMYKV